MPAVAGLAVSWLSQQVLVTCCKVRLDDSLPSVQALPAHSDKSSVTAMTSAVTAADCDGDTQDVVQTAKSNLSKLEPFRPMCDISATAAVLQGP